MAMITSLRTRLVVAVSVLALAAVAAVAWSARQGTRVEFKRFQEHDERRAPARTSRTADEIAPLLDDRCCTDEDLTRAAALLAGDDAVLVLDEGGETIASAGPGANRLRRIRTRLDGDVLRFEASREDQRTAEGIALQFKGLVPARITRSSGAPAFVHVLAIPSRLADPPAVAFLGQVDRRLVIATLVVALLVVGVTWGLTGRIVRPIDELRAAARDLARGHLARRVDATGSDEVAELGRSFNAMAAELERQQTLRRQLLHDVAHELRTPLTALRCRLETLIDGLAADPRQSLAGANEEVRHLSRLVDDLQEIAMAEARELRLTPTDVDLGDAVSSAARAAGLDADPRLRLTVNRTLRARADPVRLRQILLNLLTNAERHTPADGVITVRGDRRGDEVALEIHNTGSTLDAAQRARVFDRFYRTDEARRRSTGGSGLGLAIVKTLVEAQSGQVWVASSADAVTFGFSLPLVDPDDRGTA